MISFNSFQTFLCLSIALFAALVNGMPDGWFGTSGSMSRVGFRQPTKVHLDREIKGDLLSALGRQKRHPEHHIEDCMHMTSEEGEYYIKAKTHQVGTVCGVYMFADPDENIEIQFNYLDVPCNNGGLVVVVDGWELNGQVFPNPEDHPKSLKSRFSEFCGRRKIKQTFVSSQNVALIQYRMPLEGASFSFSIRFVKNLTPCNVLLQLEETYTLRNYDRRSNCSISSLFPAAIQVLSINVGITPTRDRGIEFETGTVHKCQKRGLDDYVQIGGSLGLDNRNMQVADSICGLSSKPARQADYIACETTSARLVSSGAFDNVLTVKFVQLGENDINRHMSVVCMPDEPFIERK